MDKIQKTFEAKQQDDGWWVASTRDVDRQMDIVEPAGLMLENYRKNNVMLWAHDYLSPFAVIGKAENIEAGENELRVLPEWREPASENDPMHIIRSLLDTGHVRALSIGFRPIEFHENEFGGLTYTKAELLEISAVPVPAQQNAVREALAYTVKALTDETDEAQDEPTPAQVAEEEPEPETEPEPDEAPDTDETDTPAAEGETIEDVAEPEADEDAQRHAPEAAAATAAADADEELSPEDEAALAEALAEMLAGVADYLREE